MVNNWLYLIKYYNQFKSLFFLILKIDSDYLTRVLVPETLTIICMEFFKASQEDCEVFMKNIKNEEPSFLNFQALLKKIKQ